MIDPMAKDEAPKSSEDVEGSAQDKAFFHYTVTGEVGGFVDPSGDQVDDIAPEFGVHPHPELQNFPSPLADVPGSSAQRATTSTVLSLTEKERIAKEAEDKAKADAKAGVTPGVVPLAPVATEESGSAKNA